MEMLNSKRLAARKRTLGGVFDRSGEAGRVTPGESDIGKAEVKRPEKRLLPADGAPSLLLA